jgi:hemerythrin-like domain-containing protein
MMSAIEGLIEEHRCIERILNALERMSSSLQSRDKVEHYQVTRIFDLITDLIEKIHHGKEENILFPLMDKYGYRRSDLPIASLLVDHDKGRALVKTMRLASANYEENPHPIIENASAYVKLIRLHIQREDAVFKVWDTKISQEDQAALSKKCAELEAVVVKQGRKNECLREIERL